MSKVKIQGNASGTGVVTLTAPNTNTDRTITLPDSTGSILDSTSTLDATKLSGALPAIDGSALTGVGGLVKTGSVTYNTATAGTQAITGVGFTPKLVHIVASIDSNDETSIGSSDGTTDLVTYTMDGGLVNDWRSASTIIIFLYQSSTTRMVSTLQSLDADGFTLSHTLIGAKTGTAKFNYTVWG